MHANLKILRKVKKNLRGRTTARPHVLESLSQVTLTKPVCKSQNSHFVHFIIL